MSETEPMIVFQALDPQGSHMRVRACCDCGTTAVLAIFDFREVSHRATTMTNREDMQCER